MASTTALKTILCTDKVQRASPPFPDVALQHLDRLAGKLEGLVAGFTDAESGQDAIRRSALRDELDRTVWELAEVVAWARILGAPDPDRFSPDGIATGERLVLDLGWISDALGGGSYDELAPAVAPVPGRQVRVELVHDLLPEVAGKVFRARELHELRERIAHKEQELAASAAAFEEARVAHSELLGSLANQDRLLEIQAKINDLLPPLGAVSGLPPGQRSMESHRQHQKLMNGWNRLRRCQEDLIDAYIDRKAVNESHNRALAAVTAFKRADAELEALRAELTETSQQTEGMSEDDVRRQIRSEFEVLRGILRHANKLSSRAVPHVALDQPPNWLPESVHAVLEETTGVDKRLANAWSQGKWEKLRIVLLPGAGPSVFDKNHETLWVPVVARDQSACSFRRSLGLYRFYQARTEQDSFRRLGPFQHIRGLDQLAESFAWAYEIFLTREAKGFRKLPTDVHKWFKLHLMQSA